MSGRQSTWGELVLPHPGSEVGTPLLSGMGDLCRSGLKGIWRSRTENPGVKFGVFAGHCP